MRACKPCNNDGKKKPTKNSTITAAITPSIGPPLFTSYLINEESCFRCSQEFASWTVCWPQVAHALVSINSHEGICAFICCMHVSYFYQWRGNNLWHPCAKAQNLFNLHLPLHFLFFLHHPLYHPPLFHLLLCGLRELLAIWMLALYCEHSLIASVLLTASRDSQHGAPTVCFICHRSVHIHCEKTEEEWSKRLREREFIKDCPSFRSQELYHLFSVPHPLSLSWLLVLLTARDNQWCTQPDFSCLVLK